jgi:hypothetical protein
MIRFLFVFLIVAGMDIKSSSQSYSLPNVTYYPQQQNQWCWAACLQMSEQYAGTQVCQCSIVDGIIKPTLSCCVSTVTPTCPSNNSCNTTRDLKKICTPLPKTGFKDIETQIQSSQLYIVAINYNPIISSHALVGSGTAIVLNSLNSNESYNFLLTLDPWQYPPYDKKIIALRYTEAQSSRIESPTDFLQYKQSTISHTPSPTAVNTGINLTTYTTSSLLTECNRLGARCEQVSYYILNNPNIVFRKIPSEEDLIVINVIELKDLKTNFSTRYQYEEKKERWEPMVVFTFNEKTETQKFSYVSLTSGDLKKTKPKKKEIATKKSRHRSAYESINKVEYIEEYTTESLIESGERILIDGVFYKYSIAVFPPSPDEYIEFIKNGKPYMLPISNSLSLFNEFKIYKKQDLIKILYNYYKEKFTNQEN